MTRLTRKQIEEGLKAYPIETLLMGSTVAKEKRLTHKQKAFAEEVAKGNTKAGAYRKAYNSKGKPETQSKNGQALAKNKAIETQIEAFRVALEAQKYTTPAHLRALTIHKLTEKALDPDIAPAQQIKALELLGKITEVALFTERREVIQTSNSTEMRAKLLNSIRLALSTQTAETIEPNQADDLLAELSGISPDDEQSPEHERQSPDDEISPDHERQIMTLDEEPSPDQDPQTPSPNQKAVTPPTPDPQNLTLADASPMHSIPHTQSVPESAVTPGVTPVTPENVEKSTACVSSSSNPILSKGEGG
jgi:hypothetical protein